MAECQILIIGVKYVQRTVFSLCCDIKPLFPGLFPPLCVNASGNNHLESQLTYLNYPTRQNRLHATRRVKSQIRSRTLNSVFTGCCLPKTNHLFFPLTRQWRTPSLSFVLFSLRPCWTGSKLMALVREERSSLGSII